MAATDTDYAKELKELAGVLASGPKLLTQLPKPLQDPEFLDHALRADRIEIGRPNHSWERKQDASESHDSRPIILKVSQTIGWTALDRPWHKPLYELLQEEETMDPQLRLRVRLARRTA